MRYISSKLLLLLIITISRDIRTCFSWNKKFDILQVNSLFREINGRFLLIEHGDPHFSLYKLNQNSVPKAK